MQRHRRDLFNPHPLRRLAALGYLKTHPSVDDLPLLRDYLKITGADELLTAPWGLRSYPCNATFIAVGVNQLLMETLRKKVALKSDAIAGMTRIEDVLICRFLGHQAEHAKEYFTQLWRHLREAVIGKTICEPRIWGT